MRPNISVVVPVYNEAENLTKLYQNLKPVLNKISANHEMIFVDDGSHDSSLDILKHLRGKDDKLKIISFSRNFGHMAAISAGLTSTSGEKVVVMDADLQDPPEIIESMYQKSRQNFKVVYGIKRNRKENLLRKISFALFYKVLNKISPYKMPANAGTFSIIDRSLVEILNQLPEKNKYISGLRAWAGFPQTGIYYERGKRLAGKEASFQRLVKLALDGLVSFSYLPLRLASLMGFIFASCAFLIAIIIVFGKLFFQIGITGWPSTISLILLVSGVQLITLGVIGEYIARIYDEVKGRPEYLISERFGFGK